MTLSKSGRKRLFRTEHDVTSLWEGAKLELFGGLMLNVFVEQLELVTLLAQFDAHQISH